ncbi:hypothetical protein BBAD15_g2733 [Beauveria bassiana D1-5]|uniref:Uncharacterized protein n=1 Tax=Beauveria bassiana D1-5 TaxID=1245745 RepID=A0A0A2WEE2_BEABA|nr:hypothetical protein BBAD15_g2733 [Beauveria bassiana D1-5]
MAAAAVYDPTVYDSLPSLDVASDAFELRNPQSIIEREIAQLFLKHNVYDELAICLLHRHFDLSPSEKLVELGAVSSPWQYAQSDSDVIGGSVEPRSWVFRNGRMFPFEFGYNEGLAPAVYQPLPEKPAFYAELNDLLLKHRLTDLLGVTLNIQDSATDTVKFEKTFDRANVVFTIQRGGQMEVKESVPAQWAYSGVGDFSVPVKK